MPLGIATVMANRCSLDAAITNSEIPVIRSVLGVEKFLESEAMRRKERHLLMRFDFPNIFYVILTRLLGSRWCFRSSAQFNHVCLP